MKKLSVLVFGVLVGLAVGQDPQSGTPGAAAIAYHQYRIKISSPTYHLAKIKGLAKGFITQNDDDKLVTNKVWSSLNPREKFTYTMIHGENFSQNCDLMPIFVNEDQKIFAYPPDPFADSTIWSDRQRQFLHNNRDLVIQLLRSTISAQNRVGVNLKQAIIEIDATELIPDMIAVYKPQRKDHDLISTCMVLMQKGKYAPFMASATYKKLYADPTSSYKSFLVANRANQDLEIQRATDFYKSTRH